QVVAPLLGQMFSEPSPNRLELWDHIDPTRTRAVEGDEPTVAWAHYALDAQVMFMRTGENSCEPATDRMTLRDWGHDGHSLGWPAEEDVYEPLTPLFPPVRPRGWFELRTIDALDDDRWPAAVELASSLLLDDSKRHAVIETNDIIDLVEVTRETIACR